MFDSIRNLCRRLRRDQAGNIAILFGASAIPLLLIMGGAVDFTRYNRYKAQLSNAVDAAALSLARHVDNYSAECPEPDEGDPGVLCEDATEDTRDFIAALSIPDDKFSVPEADITADRVWGGFVVSAEGEMQTVFLPLFGVRSYGTGVRTMDMEIVAGVQQSSNRIELALVIDNTGSMNCPDAQTGTCYNNWQTPPTDSRIVAVKAAATSLVNTLMRDNLDEPDQIKIALVPFEGAVNIGITSGPSATPAENWVAPPWWIDWNVNSVTPGQINATYGYGRAKYAGVEFQTINRSTLAVGCTASYPVSGNCRYINPGYLFRKLGVRWAGCVQMRPYSATAANNYELTDKPPVSGVYDSYWVPYFWPDEPDSSATVGSGGATKNNSDGAAYTNDYINDRNAQSTPNRALKAQAELAKYYPGTGASNPTPIATTRWHSGAKALAEDDSPYRKGPNYGCPNPIVPLTSGTATGKDAILDAIDDMVAYYSTGTFIPTGVMWGWHVLSPTLPFTEGTEDGDEYYEQTVKAMVIFTDGDNTVNGGGNHNGSFYSAWSYVAERDPDNTYRLGSDTTNSETALNTKTGTACTNAKAAGIRVYTISFGSLAAATTTMMENCATDDEDGNPLYYHAPTTTALADIFRRIGDDLTEIHLSM